MYDDLYDLKYCKGFKPYYKWIIFNILNKLKNWKKKVIIVLNLIING